MGKISKDDVLKLARLSKITLDETQLDKFAKELEELLGYIDQLQSVDTEGLEPTNQVTGLTSVMREDEIKPGVSQNELLKNAPAVENNLIKVRRVLS
jgi:aspartyl-tRNA(Asn)/glutamyl-tRNA(Gln) amidotransferase subunit C